MIAKIAADAILFWLKKKVLLFCKKSVDKGGIGMLY
jgi:hypothetical protein